MASPLFLLAFQLAANVPQYSSDWCHPVFANVTGRITVNCNGIDPRALDLLNARLSLVNADSDERLRRANAWAEKYKQLEKSLEEAGVASPLAKEAEGYLRRGEIDKAGQLLDRIISQEGQTLTRLASDHFNRALVHELQFHEKEAVEHLERAHRFAPGSWRYAAEYVLLLAQEHRTLEERKLFEDMAGFIKKGTAEEVPYAALVLFCLAQYSSDQGRYGDAIDAYNLAFEGLMPLVTTDLRRYFVTWIQIATNLGDLYVQTKQYDEAEGKFTEALAVETLAAEADPIAIAPFIARTWKHVGDLRREEGNFDASSEAYNKALEQLQKAVQKDPESYKPLVAEIMTGEARVFAEGGYIQVAIALLQPVIAIIRPLVEKDPIRYRPFLAKTLSDRARLLAEDGGFDESNAEFAESVELWKETIGISPESSVPSLVATMDTQGISLTLEGKIDDAEKCLTEALDYARSFEAFDASPNKIESRRLLAIALASLTKVAVKKEKWQKATEYGREALRLFPDVVKTDPKQLQPMQVETLSEQADAYAQIRKYDLAESSYLEMLKITQQVADADPSDAATPAEAESTVAEFYLFRGDEEKAFDHAQKSVSLYRRLRPGSANLAPYLSRALMVEAGILSKRPNGCSQISALIEEARAQAESEVSQQAARELVSNCGKLKQ